MDHGKLWKILKVMGIPDHLTCLLRNLYAGQAVWYSHHFKNFPQFVVILTVKGFGIVNKAEVDVFLELSCFYNDQMLAIEPDILECEVKWALGSITTKLVEVMEFQLSYFEP